MLDFRADFLKHVHERSDNHLFLFSFPRSETLSAREHETQNTVFLPNLPSAQPKIQTLCLQKKTSSQRALPSLPHTGEPQTIQQTLKMLHINPQGLLWNNDEKRAVILINYAIFSLSVCWYQRDIAWLKSGKMQGLNIRKKIEGPHGAVVPVGDTKKKTKDKKWRKKWRSEVVYI